MTHDLGNGAPMTYATYSPTEPTEHGSLQWMRI